MLPQSQYVQWQGDLWKCKNPAIPVLCLHDYETSSVQRLDTDIANIKSLLAG